LTTSAEHREDRSSKAKLFSPSFLEQSKNARNSNEAEKISKSSREFLFGTKFLSCQRELWKSYEKTDLSIVITSDNIRLHGFKLYIYEEWLLEMDLSSCCAVENTENPEDTIIVCSVQAKWPPRLSNTEVLLREYFLPKNDLFYLKETPMGTILVYVGDRYGNRFPLGNSKIPVPDGDFDRNLEGLELQLTLKRMSFNVQICAGKPISSLIEHEFRSQFGINWTMPLAQAVKTFVKQLQAALIHLKYLPSEGSLSEVNSHFDTRTMNALKSFQSHFHILETGFLNLQTYQAIISKLMQYKSALEQSGIKITLEDPFRDYEEFNKTILIYESSLKDSKPLYPLSSSPMASNQNLIGPSSTAISFPDSSMSIVSSNTHPFTVDPLSSSMLPRNELKVTSSPFGKSSINNLNPVNSFSIPSNNNSSSSSNNNNSNNIDIRRPISVPSVTETVSVISPPLSPPSNILRVNGLDSPMAIGNSSVNTFQSTSEDRMKISMAISKIEDLVRCQDETVYQVSLSYNHLEQKFKKLREDYEVMHASIERYRLQLKEAKRSFTVLNSGYMHSLQLVREQKETIRSYTEKINRLEEKIKVIQRINARNGLSALMLTWLSWFLTALVYLILFGTTVLDWTRRRTGASGGYTKKARQMFLNGQGSQWIGMLGEDINSDSNENGTSMQSFQEVTNPEKETLNSEGIIGIPSTSSTNFPLDPLTSITRRRTSSYSNGTSNNISKTYPSYKKPTTFSELPEKRSAIDVLEGVSPPSTNTSSSSSSSSSLSFLSSTIPNVTGFNPVNLPTITISPASSLTTIPAETSPATNNMLIANSTSNTASYFSNTSDSSGSIRDLASPSGFSSI